MIDSHRFSERFSSVYDNNVIYQWQVWLTGNVTQVYFEFNSFNTEPVNDYLTIFGSSPASQTLSGSGISYSAPQTVKLTGSWGDNYVDMFWKTSANTSLSGWRIVAVWVYCGWSYQPAKPNTISSQLFNNSQRDGVLLGTGDIRYYTTIQKANQSMLLHLKRDASTYAGQDFNLYASTLTSVPNPTGYQWKSDWTGTQEETIYLPAVGADR